MLRAVAGAGDIDDIQVVLPDEAVQAHPNQRLRRLTSREFSPDVVRHLDDMENRL
jgi:hypothetical protein